MRRRPTWSSPILERRGWSRESDAADGLHGAWCDLMRTAEPRPSGLPINARPFGISHVCQSCSGVVRSDGVEAPHGAETPGAMAKTARTVRQPQNTTSEPFAPTCTCRQASGFRFGAYPREGGKMKHFLLALVLTLGLLFAVAGTPATAASDEHARSATSAGAWIPTGSLNTARMRHTATPKRCELVCVSGRIDS
jgi:hypothetical protein